MVVVVGGAKMVKKKVFRYGLKGFCLNYSSRFPEWGGNKKANPTMTVSTITASRKGDPPHMFREKKSTNEI